MARAGAKNFQEYARILRQKPGQVQVFKDHITINVSEFFRDKTAFDLLRDKMVPMLLASRNRLDIWSAGCSTGEEAYSLSILLEERRRKSKPFDYSILGTDIDEDAIGRAKLGLYAKSALKNVNPIQLQEHFRKTNQGFLIKPALRLRIIFEKFDLLKDVSKRKFNLILCRNVAIYFIEKYKEKVYASISKVLLPDGILFLGNSERLFEPGKFGLEKLGSGFYRKLN